MLRIRWTERGHDSGEWKGWKLPSVMLASLFLNFFFWYEPANHFWSSSSLFWSTVLATGLVVGLFFLGPAFAGFETQRSLFELAERSLGVWPGIVFRFLCAVLCVLWIGGICGSLLCHVLVFLLHGRMNSLEAYFIAMLAMLFLFLTGLQGFRTSAQLASFTCQLGVALLIAAAIRVCGYFPQAWSDFTGVINADWNVWSQLGELLVIIGPMALLATAFGGCCRSRKDVSLIGIAGLGAPMACTLFVVSFIQRAAYHWHANYGNLANIALALWGDDAGRYLGPWMMMSIITVFGIGRFGVQLWRVALEPVVKARALRIVVLAISLLLGSALSVGSSPLFSMASESVARFAASVAAVLTAEVLRRRTGRVAAVDWVTLACLSTGWIAGSALSTGVTAGILMSYGVSFVCCAVGRFVERRVLPDLV